jgi:hypothetical protein
LHLVQSNYPSSPEGEECKHLEGQKLENFEDIGHNIEFAPNKLANVTTSVSPDPISLLIHSPKVENLILVDLLGLMKVPVPDQTKDIEAQIKEMIEKFIRSEKTVVLAR